LQLQLQLATAFQLLNRRPQIHLSFLFFHLPPAFLCVCQVGTSIKHPSTCLVSFSFWPY
jgi:hypothetical protein